MKSSYILGLICAVLLTGCSKSTVVVVDISGKPISGAQVTGTSLSMSTSKVITNAKGKANVPSNIQGIKWVQVEKVGFKSTLVAIPTTWPLKITLKKNDSL